MRWGARQRRWSWRRFQANRWRSESSCPRRSSSANPAASQTGSSRQGGRSAVSDGPDPEVERLLERMTLREKVGQMTQADVHSLRPRAVTELGLGSVLSGGGGNPTPNTPAAWAAMVRRVQDEALESRLGIPLLYGVDAVHGHSNMRGATIFPHNVGLGATGDPGLVERVGRVTATELLATNVRWGFAPAVSGPQDIRWGRTYQAYGAGPALGSSLG